MKKRLLSLLLAVMMLLTLFPTALAEGTEDNAVEPEVYAAAAEPEEDEVFAAVDATSGATVKWGTCGTNASFILRDNGVMQFSGSGTIWCPLSSAADRLLVKEIQVPSGITALDDFCFREFSALTKVTLADSVTSIGEYCFYGCSELKTISFPSGLKTIGSLAFYNCTALPSVSIPSGTSVGYHAFFNCTSLTSATVGSSSMSMPFSSCSKLSSITLSSTVTKLPDDVFSGLTALKAITIPSSVKSIGNNVFDGDSLTVTFSGDAPSFSSLAFSGATVTAQYPDSNSTWTSSVRQSYGGSVTWKGIGTPPSVSGVTAPKGTRIQGKALTLKGTINAGSGTLQKVSARIYAQSDTSLKTPLTGKEVSASGKTYSIQGSTLDTNCKLGSLKVGSYVYIITATVGGTKYELYRSKFTVTSATYTVTYDANGGTNAPKAQTKSHDKTLTLSTEEPVRYEYEFQGWATSKTATSAAYQPGDAYTANKAVTLYAVWKSTPYTITFRASGDDYTPPDPVRVVNKQITIPTFDVTPTHVYSLKNGDFEVNFVSWQGYNEGGTEYWYPGQTYSYTYWGSCTAYPTWENLTRVNLVCSDQNMTLASTVFSDRYKDFQYGARDNATIADLGIVLFDENNWPYDTTANEGYMIEGWYYSANGETVRVTENTVFEKNKGYLVYPKWVQMDSVVAKGTVDDGKVAYTLYDTGELVLSTNQTALGYTQTQALPESVRTAATTVTIREGTVTTSSPFNSTYCTWPNLTTVNLPDSLSALNFSSSYCFSGLPKLTTVNIGPNSKLDAITYGFENCPNLKTIRLPESITFLNYLCKDAAFTEVYFEGDAPSRRFDLGLETNAGTVTVSYSSLREGWTEEFIQEHDNANIIWSDRKRVLSCMDGETEVGTYAGEAGETVTLESLEREDYVFLGWAADPEATEPDFEGGESYALAENTTLYAVWQLLTRSVVLDANDGSGEVTQLEGVPGEALSLDVLYTRAGYALLGWSADPEAAEADYAVGEMYTVTEDTELYAVWLAPDFVLPAALTALEEEAFAGGAFRFARLPYGAEEIGSQAFADCAELRFVYIPETVTVIAKDAFSGVEGLTILSEDGSYAEFFAQKNGFGFRAVG